MRMESVELIPRRGISLVRAAAARASNPPASATGGSVAGAVKRDATGRMEIEASTVNDHCKWLASALSARPL